MTSTNAATALDRPVSAPLFTLNSDEALKVSIGTGKVFMEVTYGGLVSDLEVEQYGQDILDKLASLVELPPNVTPRLHILNSREPNACMFPDGTTYITVGCLSLCESEDEVAYLLGHELAHLEKGHFKVEARNSIQRLGITRLNEREADISSAAKLLDAAGYNPTCAIDVWRKIHARSRREDEAYDLQHGTALDRVVDMLLLSCTAHMKHSAIAPTSIPVPARDAIGRAWEEASENTPVTEKQIEDALDALTPTRESWAILMTTTNRFFSEQQRDEIADHKMTDGEYPEGWYERLSERMATRKEIEQKVTRRLREFVAAHCPDRDTASLTVFLISVHCGLRPDMRDENPEVFRRLTKEQSFRLLDKLSGTLSNLRLCFCENPILSPESHIASDFVTGRVLSLTKSRKEGTNLAGIGKTILDDGWEFTERLLDVLEPFGRTFDVPRTYADALSHGCSAAAYAGISWKTASPLSYSRTRSACDRLGRLYDIFCDLRNPEESLLFLHYCVGGFERGVGNFIPRDDGYLVRLRHSIVENLQEKVVTAAARSKRSLLDQKKAEAAESLQKKAAFWGLTDNEMAVFAQTTTPYPHDYLARLSDMLPNEGANPNYKEARLDKLIAFTKECSRRIPMHMALPSMACSREMAVFLEPLDLEGIRAWLEATTDERVASSWAEGMLREIFARPYPASEKLRAIDVLSSLSSKALHISDIPLGGLLESLFKEIPGVSERLAALSALVRNAYIEGVHVENRFPPSVIEGVREICQAAKSPEEVFAAAHFLPKTSWAQHARMEAFKRMLDTMTFPEALEACRGPYPSVREDGALDWLSYLIDHKCSQDTDFETMWEVVREELRANEEKVGAAVFAEGLFSSYATLTKDSSREFYTHQSPADLLNACLVSSIDEKPLIRYVADGWVHHALLKVTPDREKELERWRESWIRLGVDEQEVEKHVKAYAEEVDNRRLTPASTYVDNLYGLSKYQKFGLLKSLLLNPKGGILHDKDGTKSLLRDFVAHHVHDTPEAIAALITVADAAVDVFTPDELFVYAAPALLDVFLMPPSERYVGREPVDLAIDEQRKIASKPDHEWQEPRDTSWIEERRECMIAASGFVDPGVGGGQLSSDLFPEWAREQPDAAGRFSVISAAVQTAKVNGALGGKLIQFGGIALPTPQSTKDELLRAGAYSDFPGGQSPLAAWSLIKREDPEFFEQFSLGEKIGEGSTYSVHRVLTPSGQDTGTIVRILNPNIEFRCSRMTDQLKRVCEALLTTENAALADGAKIMLSLLDLVQQGVVEDIRSFNMVEGDHVFRVVDGLSLRKGQFGYRISIPKILSSRGADGTCYVVREESAPGMALSKLLASGDQSPEFKARLSEISALLASCFKMQAQRVRAAHSDLHAGNVIEDAVSGTLSLIDRNRPASVPVPLIELLDYRPGAIDLVRLLMPGGRERLLKKFAATVVEKLFACTEFPGSTGKEVARAREEITAQVTSHATSLEPSVIFEAVQSIMQKGGRLSLDAMLIAKSLYYVHDLCLRAGYEHGVADVLLSNQ